MQPKKKKNINVFLKIKETHTIISMDAEIRFYLLLCMFYFATKCKIKQRQTRKLLCYQCVLLLLLSRFSSVRLCDPIDGIPLGSSVPGILQARVLEWVAIAFSNAWKWKVKSESEVAQSCPTPSDPMDCSPPGSSVHGIFQIRVLEWVAIAFSDQCIKIPKICCGASKANPKHMNLYIHI